MKFLEILKSLFKSNTDINKIFDTVATGVDKLGLSSQEKADSTREFVKETLSENTERSRARRYIAKFLIYNYILVFWITVICIFFKAEIAKAIITTIDAYGLTYAFFTVLAFYFGGYYLGKFTPKSNKKQQ